MSVKNDPILHSDASHNGAECKGTTAEVVNQVVQDNLPKEVRVKDQEGNDHDFVMVSSEASDKEKEEEVDESSASKKESSLTSVQEESRGEASEESSSSGTSNLTPPKKPYIHKLNCDYIQIAAIIIELVAIPITGFALLVAMGIFPTSLLGGVIGASAISILGGIVVVTSSSVLFLRCYSPPINARGNPTAAAA